MPKKIFYLLSAVLFVFLIVGCAQQAAPTTNTPGSQPAVNTSAGANMVSIQNFAFNPSTLNIKVGDTVTWTNNDTASHTVKLDSITSPQLRKSESFQNTFNQAGIFDYICSIHPSMKGKIIVSE